ncbi:methylglutaconyl-CoA hydratase [Pseudomonas citronellolis]|uniref:gamma-carboxygeranoyl-CoA hydratase n=1 Tax=Pseudomonas citronellolis TaxID=53408 RepID=UPI0020A0D3D2|nr:gamma-carboxygeranoyl-CoA hydratase [Pseudomonas citronellolis]MCP1645396.1 methylglutaconyl-CoA hydratase [Pseudomonas citronellolis]MCP1668785.1 methylglutaconyl-CoA hydratase [Pseudomonas citronellolis]MCP1699774.1 methylglutaconyl-CoA hydratase [Pseudomonas citronellolis]MCP1703726.1 methylglutaconyl-CoA hydratase [Pseudomonas citronellolis]MCP1800452.1 methylglutaconyl-CoA hydratase [Pseudomonas citronellolis]
MTDFQNIQLEKDPRGVATLWLNRPDKNNAFNAATIAELIRALDQVADDAEVRLLVLRGRGRHFCGGADLAWMQEAVKLDYQGNLADAQQLAELLNNLHLLKKPTLAVVQGAAFGGGVGLVACCDMALGSEQAQFCLSEVRIGLIPATIGPFVTKAIGQRAATRYALTAERFDGARARELGLLDECYAAEELEEKVEAWVANLLCNSPCALMACKALFQEIGSGELSPNLRRYTEAAIARIRISPEGQEGLHAFLEKRKPAWQGGN